MQIKSINHQNKIQFNGNLSQIPKLSAGYIPKQITLAKKEIPIIDILSFITAFTGFTGFSIGGAGLLYDFLNDIRTKKGKIPVPVDSLLDKNDVFTEFKAKIKTNTIKNQHKAGVNTVTPNTEFGKIGLQFAKAANGISAAAGVFNGLSMRLPLISVGELINIGASPVLETPFGTGLFGIALASIYAGRALDLDPSLKLDPIKFNSCPTIGKKAFCVYENIINSIKEVLKSSKLFYKNFIGLFTSDRKNSINFFTSNLFSVKPKQLLLQEFVNKEGKTVLKVAFKNNPYLMHLASLILATGGGILAISSILNFPVGQKIGLRTFNVGNMFDNMSLMRWGMQKSVMSRTAAEKVSGKMCEIAGGGILASQPGIDATWGRGIQFVGIAALMASFAFDRTHNVIRLFKNSSTKEELISLVRQWELDLTKIFPDKKSFKENIDSIMKSVNQDTEFYNQELKTIYETVKSVIIQEKQNINSVNNLFSFNPDSKIMAKKIEKAIFDKFGEKYKDIIQHYGNDANFTNTIKNLEAETTRILAK